MSDTLRARIAALHAGGAARAAPMRCAQVEALARRLHDAPEALRPLLAARLEAALAQLAQAVDASAAAAGDPPRVRKPVPRATPLAELNHLLQARATPRSAAGGELGSVSRFRRVWARTRARDEVQRAAAQKPANAGPLNSHALLAQMLDLMQDLPGDYLRHFVAHAEGLLWLQDVAAELPTAATPARPKKKAALRRR